jgi:zinc and cadmium transporter
MKELIYIIVASVGISLGALVGVLTLAVKEAKLTRALMLLVSFSAGAMMGGAFLHLLPEAVETLAPDLALTAALLSFMGFFLVEKLLHWRHCHQGHCPTHTFGYLNLIGDSIHNFIDGLIIAAAFLTDIRLGLVTAAAVALHEIPQEIGDFGVLLYSGFSKNRALTANFLVALTVVLGGVAGYWSSFWLEDLVAWLLPVAAGGFIYIAASDLMPEIRKELGLKKSLAYVAAFFGGMGMMYLLK